MFENYEDCLFNDNIILKSQQRFKIDCHNVYTEQINTIALRSNDDNRLQTSKTLQLNLQHIHSEQTHLKYVKVRCKVK